MSDSDRGIIGNLNYSRGHEKGAEDAQSEVFKDDLRQLSEFWEDNKDYREGYNDARRDAERDKDK